MHTKVQHLLLRLSGVKKKKGGHQAKCPAHDDGSPSLSIDVKNNKILLKCHAGCKNEDILYSLQVGKDALFLDESANFAQSKITLESLAENKRIPLSFLLELHINNDGGGKVRIPYFHENGEEGRARLRHNHIANKGTTYNGGDGEVILYGLWKLDEARKSKAIVFVEGESDCWSLWLNDYPALGFPGASMTGKLKSGYLQGIERIYVIDEKDDGGTNFVRGVQEKLDELKYTGKVYTVRMPEGFKDPNDLLKKHGDDFRSEFYEILRGATPLEERRVMNFVTGTELERMSFPEPKWAIPEMLPEGLTIFAGRPKKGKSWLALNIALSIASGGVALGYKAVEKGCTLYIALEDSQRRVQDRIKTLLGEGESFPINLHILTELDNNIWMSQVEEYLSINTNCRLVIIDTLARIRKTDKKKNSDSYQEDYEFAGALQKLATKNGIALVLIHHTRKPGKNGDEYALDSVSGTSGLTGAADSIWVLKNSPLGKGNAVLSINGRDIQEQEYAAKIDNGIWCVLGDSDEYTGTQERKQILELLGKVGPLSPKEIADSLGKPGDAIRQLLMKMKNIDLVSQYGERGKYYV